MLPCRYEVFVDTPGGADEEGGAVVVRACGRDEEGGVDARGDDHSGAGRETLAECALERCSSPFDVSRLQPGGRDVGECERRAPAITELASKVAAARAELDRGRPVACLHRQVAKIV